MELNPTTMTADQLRSLLPLVDERDRIKAEIQSAQALLAGVEAKIEALANGKPLPAVAPVTTTARNGKGHVTAAKVLASKPRKNKPKPSTTKAKPSKASIGRTGKSGRTPHGSVETTILAALKKAGTKGLSVKDICAEFKLKEDTVSKWLGAHIKTSSSGLTRPSRGIYVLKETESVAPAAA